MSSLELCRVGAMVYPVMLAQEAGEVSESKAAEMLDLDIVTYREKKQTAIAAIVKLVETLPSPLTLLMESTKDRPVSSTKSD